ncbi:hypothetical protein ACEN88_24440, partial [Massilia sp. CT11-108]|uniref:hypothetical protein n=1 Tax=Massilia sp. CT11-108 TaxID=3393900 RepID=UPI0039A6EAE1
MQDEAIYRCINTACARGMPRRVQYCPYCGTAQQAGAPPPPQDDGHVRRVAADNVTTAAAATAGAEAVAGLSGWSDAPDTVQEAPPQPSPKPTPPATAFGHGGRPVEAHTA